MAGTFEVAWLPGGILLLRRSGMLTVDEANAYVAAALAALEKTPARWAAIVDLRRSVAQTDDVQTLVQDLVKQVASKNPQRMAVVSGSAITTIQERRITIGPGLHDPSTVVFHDDYDAALAELKKLVL